MFHKIFKLILSAIIMIWAVMSFVDGSIGNAIAISFLSLLFLLLYFKNEFLLMAFFQVRRQNMGGAEKWLVYIKNPKKSLIRSQQAYFYFLHGMIASQNNNNMSRAETNFKKALSLGLKMNHNIAMAKLNLAGIAMQKRRKREATQLINQAKKADKYGMLKDQIAMMKRQLKRV